MDGKDAPGIISSLGIMDWYSTLDDKNVIKLNRYLRKGLDHDPDSASDFFRTIAAMANDDENYEFAGMMALEGLKREKGDLRIFQLNEEMIEALINLGASGSAKKFCYESIDMFPRIVDGLKENNGGCFPCDIRCRNRLIDILVGIEKDYEAAYAALDVFLERGLITEDERDYRRNSLKIHRLQRTFDGIYSLKPSDE